MYSTFIADASSGSKRALVVPARATPSTAGARHEQKEGREVAERTEEMEGRTHDAGCDCGCGCSAAAAEYVPENKGAEPQAEACDCGCDCCVAA